MSERLDSMFTALGTRAESLPLPDAASVRRLGERRRRNRVLAGVTVAAVMALVAALAGTWFAERPGRSAPAVVPTISVSPDAFSPLRTVGGPVNAFPTSGAGAAEIEMVSMAGGRAYTAWRARDGKLWIGAANLATGTVAWAPRTVGTFGDWNGVLARPEAVVLIGEYDDGTTPGYQLVVVDPDTGAVRWRQPFDINDDELCLYDLGMVLATQADGKVRLLDWRTGTARWTIPSAGTQLVHIEGMHAPAELTGHTRGDAFGLEAQDHRLLRVTADGTAREYDARGGQLTRTWRLAGATDRDASYLGYNGTWYEAAGDQVRAYRPGAAVVPVSTGRTVRAMTPCGTGLLCVLGDASTATELAAVDPTNGHVAWRASVPNAETVFPVADRVVVTSSAPPVESRIFDAHGRQVLDEADRGALVTRVDGGGMLLWHYQQDTGEMTTPTDLVGMDVDGRRVPLGRATVRAPLCDWNSRYLACPTGNAFQVWRMTDD